MARKGKKKIVVQVPAKPALVVAPLGRARNRNRRRRRAARLNTETTSGGMSIMTPVRPPAAAGMVLRRNNPTVNGSRRPVIIENCEMLAPVSVSSTQNLGSLFRATAGSSVAWIAGVSSNWSKWRWLSLRFVYIPATGTTTSGSVAMGLLYDVIDNAPTVMSAMSSLQGFATGPVWSGASGAKLLQNPRGVIPPDAIVTSVDVNRFKNPWYSWNSANTITQALALAFPQNIVANELIPVTLRLLTTGGTATTPLQVGELFMCYSIELIEPIASASQDA